MIPKIYRFTLMSESKKMDWEKRINMAYVQQLDAKKPDNPELIDVQDRFRLIEVNGQTYVTKKSKPVQAEAERTLAAEAAARLNGCFVDDLSLRVVVPEVVLFGDAAYLITPYLGKTLQSIRYTQVNPVIQKKMLHQILQIFKDRGIRYRGFLPRNTILGDETLYLIDWEDTTFFDVGTDVPGNLIAETNFVLNWMYNYDAEELRAMYRRVYRVLSEQNIPLNQYETILCYLCGQATDSVSDARSFVEALVLAAEAPYNGAQNSVILPADCASVVSDIFTPYIDAFFDILCAYLRREDEDGYLRWLDFLGTYIRDNPNIETQTQGQIISILLMMYLTSGQTIDWLVGEDSGWVLSRLQLRLEHLPLMHAFLRPNPEQLKRELWPLLKRITGNPAIEKVEAAHTLVAEILVLSEARHNVGKLVWENAFYRFIRTGKTSAIPGSYVFLRKKKSGEFTESEAVCYAETVQMLRLFLASQDVPISGIYTQSARDGTLTTMILPYHIPVLRNLNIPLDEYQPHIELYLDYFEEIQSTASWCEYFDDKLKSFASVYKKEETINGH